MNKIVEDLKNSLGYHFVYTENLKDDIINAIQNIIIEYNNINYYKRIIKCNKNKLVENCIIVFLKKMEELDKDKIKIIVNYIVHSNILKNIFNINKNINDDEINDLVEEIFSSILYLNFDTKEDISNYIIEFSKKYINS